MNQRKTSDAMMLYLSDSALKDADVLMNFHSFALIISFMGHPDIIGYTMTVY